MSHNFYDVLLAFVAVLPATIAAISSLRNGSKIKQVQKDVRNGEEGARKSRIKYGRSIFPPEKQ